MSLQYRNNNKADLLFAQHRCQSGLDAWLRNLSHGLQNEGVKHRTQWLNHLAEPMPFLFSRSVPRAKIIHTVPALARYLRKKCKYLIITAHSFAYDKQAYINRNPLKQAYWNLIRSYEQTGLKNADRVVCVSTNTQKRLKALFAIDSQLIYPGVDTDLFQPKKDLPRDRIPEKLKLFFSGNLSHKKGFDLLLKLSGLLGNEVEIRIACGLKGTKKGRYSPQGNILFLGGMSFNSPQLVREFQECDIFIATSRLEGLSLALIEAMACGKPVVALNAGGSAEAVDEAKGGYVVPGKNLQEMTDRIRYLKGHPELREQMGAYNRRKAERHFSLSTFAQGYIKLFNLL